MISYNLLIYKHDQEFENMDKNFQSETRINKRIKMVNFKLGNEM